MKIILFILDCFNARVKQTKRGNAYMHFYIILKCTEIYKFSSEAHSLKKKDEYDITSVNFNSFPLIKRTFSC